MEWLQNPLFYKIISITLFHRYYIDFWFFLDISFTKPETDADLLKHCTYIKFIKWSHTEWLVY